MPLTIMPHPVVDFGGVGTGPVAGYLLETPCFTACIVDVVSPFATHVHSGLQLKL